jgi:hypothetical protein
MCGRVPPPKEHVLMTRSIVSGLLGLLSVIVLGSLPVACQSGGVGDPCTPEDEYDPRFAGFKVTEENIESRSFQCQTRICLVNHFQGRVSCPLGQVGPQACNGPDDNTTCGTKKCVQSAIFAPECDSNDDCGGRTCNTEGKFCECQSATDCPLDGVWFCGADRQCKAYVCHDESASGCQKAGVDPSENEGKACCVPGTTVPIAAPVCGQCADDSNRNAEQAVYCSCRCGVAEGEADDPDFNFCECPDGFTCSEIRKDVGLGDKQITGKYCIKESTEFKTEQACGQVRGYFDSNQCKGIGL